VNARVVALLLVVCVSCCSCAAAESGRRTSTVQSDTQLTLGKPVKLRAKVHGELVTASTVAAGDVLLLGTSGGHLYAVDLHRAGAKPRRLATLSEKVYDVAASPDGLMVGAVSVGGSAAVGPVAGNVRVGTLDNAPQSVGFDASGDRVAFAGFGVAVHDAHTGSPIGSHEQPVGDGGRSAYTDVGFTKTGEIVAADDKGIDRWTPTSREAVGTTVECDCSSVAFSGDATTIAFSTADGHLVIMDPSKGLVREDRTVTTDMSDRVTAVAMSDSGRRVAAFTLSGKGLLWDQRLGRITWRGRLAGKMLLTEASFVGENALTIGSQTDESDEGSGFGLAPFLVRFSR
jgi:hypothetical protein